MRFLYSINIHALFFVTIQLNILNFLIKKSQILNLIELQGCLGFIDGSSSPTVTITLAKAIEQVIPKPIIVIG